MVRAWTLAMFLLFCGNASPLAQAVEGLPTSAVKGQHERARQTEGVALFPSRDASGTSWLPDETPMDGAERTIGAWRVMVHVAFGQFLYEPDDKHRTGGSSSSHASTINWLMASARRAPCAGEGRMGLRAMLSAEPWTVRDCGFIKMTADADGTLFNW